MYRVGFIPVDRKSPEKAAKSIINMTQKIREGNTILIYPEGTRNSKNDQMLPLKKGAMAVATKSKAPIIPIITFDTKQIYSSEKKGILFPQKIKIKVLDPIHLDSHLHPANQSSKMNIDEQLNRIHDIMQKAFNKLKTESQTQ